MSEEMDMLRKYLANIGEYEKRETEWKAEQERLAEENARLEAELEKTKRNRDTILAEKRIVEGKTGNMLRGTETELHISAADALDPQRYRAMKALAARQGRTLRIVSEGHSQEQSAVKFVRDEDRGVLYANRRLLQQLGIVRLRQIAADERRSLDFFGNVDDLPAHLHRRHAEIAHGPDRDARMEIDHD